MARPPTIQAPAEAAAAVVPTTATARRSILDDLFLPSPPPLDPVWLAHERALNLPNPRPVVPPLQRQPLYVVECRELNASMMAPGARDHHLAQGVVTRHLTYPSSLDGFPIPVLEYTLDEDEKSTGSSGDRPVAAPSFVVVYIHGGGLHIGEADSEDLSCRRILKEAKLPSGGRLAAVCSIGYRLMPQHPASTCVADCVDAFRQIGAAAPPEARLLLVGSSSGGELAALVAQEEAAAAAVRAGGGQGQLQQPHSRRPLQGVVLRCPVTSDAFNGVDAYVPAPLRRLHTSTGAAFQTTLLGPMRRLQPRDGLARMPLEAPPLVLRAQPRHWIQVCTNDMLYSDGVCYAKALEDAGVEVAVDAVVGWPHTFWLKTPWMDRALEADRAMLRGLAWVAGGPLR